MTSVELIVEKIIYGCRWVLAVFYLGLVLVLICMGIRFVQSIHDTVIGLLYGNEVHYINAVLEVIDVTLLSNLVLIIIYCGYENFVSIIEVAKNHKDRPIWMERIDFMGLKLKLVGSIVALSAVNLLSCFLNIDSVTKDDLMWKIALHLTFMGTGLFLAITEFVVSKSVASELVK